MTLLYDSVDSKKLDVRVIERNIARGVITQDDVEKAMKKLPDDAANADWISLDTLESGEVSDDLANGQTTHH